MQPTQPNQVVISPGLTDAVLTEVLAPFSAAKWLHFTDLPAVFAGLANPEHRSEFEAWLDRVVLPWCCKPTGDDGGSIASSLVAGGGGQDDGVGMSALDFGVGAADGGDGVGGSAAGSVGGGSGNSNSGFASLQVITEVPTAVPGWAMVEVKARMRDNTDSSQQGGGGAGVPASTTTTTA